MKDRWRNEEQEFIKPIEMRNISTFISGNCQAPGPVPGQSQHSYLDSQREGPGLTL